MSFNLGRTIIDGLKNTFVNIPLDALQAEGVPSSTTVLYGDGLWKQPILVAPVSPAYDQSGVSAGSGTLTSGTPFSWRSGVSTGGSWGIVEIIGAAGSGNMTLAADVEVTWGGIPMVSKGHVYDDNVSTFGWSWVFELDGIPDGDSLIVVTPTQAGKNFVGYGMSFSYTNVASTGALQTAYGAGNPSLTVAAANNNDILWGALYTAASTQSAQSGFTVRQHTPSILFAYAGETTGVSSATFGATSSTVAWSAVGMDLIAAVNPLTAKEDKANKNQANGYAGLDGSGKVAAAQLPSYVDDALEFANLAAFPGTGSSGIIYVADDTGKIYRWSGSAYIEISPSPGSTDAVSEGSTNLYYTNARADARVAAGNAATATRLATARNINGVAFDGSAAITVADSTKTPNLVPTAVKTSAYTAAVNNFVPVNAASAAVIITLPTAPTDLSRIAIKKIDSSANAVTVAAGGSDVFNTTGGPVSGSLTLQNQAMVLQYSSALAIWYVISADTPLSQLDTRYVQKATPTFVEYIDTTSVSGVTVPSGILGVEIVSLIAPGAGGGSGRLSASGTIAGGGGGGGSGSKIAGLFIPAADLGATYAVSIPTAGAGGAAVSTASTNGNPGTSPGGGVASFTSGSVNLRAGAGFNGAGGTNTVGGTGGVAGGFGTAVGAAGGTGSSTTSAGSNGSQSVLGGPGGGGGGGAVTATPAASNGGAGGIQNPFGTGSAPAGGIVGGASPSAGSATLSTFPGAGAAGGAGATSGAAQAGASATGFGGGGGGGGGSIGSSSGAGGNGGPGYLGIRWVYS